MNKDEKQELFALSSNVGLKNGSLISYAWTKEYLTLNLTIGEFFISRMIDRLKFNSSSRPRRTIKVQPNISPF